MGVVHVFHMMPTKEKTQTYVNRMPRTRTCRRETLPNTKRRQSGSR
jgi:hypothetical protein